MEIIYPLFLLFWAIYAKLKCQKLLKSRNQQKYSKNLVTNLAKDCQWARDLTGCTLRKLVFFVFLTKNLKTCVRTNKVHRNSRNSPRFFPSILVFFNHRIDVEKGTLFPSILSPLAISAIKTVLKWHFPSRHTSFIRKKTHFAISHTQCTLGCHHNLWFFKYSRTLEECSSKTCPTNLMSNLVNNTLSNNPFDLSTERPSFALSLSLSHDSTVLE